MGLKTYSQKLIGDLNQAFAQYEYKRAFELIEQCLSQAPLDPHVRYTIGYHLEQLGRFEECIPHLEFATSLKSIPDWNLRLGLAYRGLGRFDEAYSEFSKAFRAAPNNEMYKKLVIDSALNCEVGISELLSTKTVDSNSIFKLISPALAQKRSGTKVHITFPSEKIQINQVSTLGPAPQSLKTGETESGTASLWSMKNVTVFGRSDLVFDLDSKEIIADILRFPNAPIVDLTFNQMIMGHNSKIAVTNFSYNDVQQFSEAIVFLSATSNAFGHWFFEHLPRLEMLLANSKLRSVPLLVDEGLHKNHIETLYKIVGTGRPIEFISKDCRVNISKAYILSNRTFMPTLMRPHAEASIHDAPVAISVFEFLRSKLGPPPKSTGLRLYLARRHSTWRKLVNENEIIQVVRERGFEVVDAENISFDVLSGLVAQANVIVGPAGSAMNNTVFAPKGSHAVFLSPPDVGNYVTFLSTLNEAGINAHFYCGMADESQLSKHSNFTIPIEDFKFSIDAIIRP